LAQLQLPTPTYLELELCQTVQILCFLEWSLQSSSTILYYEDPLPFNFLFIYTKMPLNYPKLLLPFSLLPSSPAKSGGGRAGGAGAGGNQRRSGSAARGLVGGARAGGGAWAGGGARGRQWRAGWSATHVLSGGAGAGGGVRAWQRRGGWPAGGEDSFFFSFFSIFFRSGAKNLPNTFDGSATPIGASSN
jgi:hypothetical protein